MLLVQTFNRLCFFLVFVTAAAKTLLNKKADVKVRSHISLPVLYLTLLLTHLRLNYQHYTLLPLPLFDFYALYLLLF